MCSCHSNSPAGSCRWHTACISNNCIIRVKYLFNTHTKLYGPLKLTLSVLVEKFTRWILSCNVKSPWISTIGSGKWRHRSKTSVEVLQDLKCTATSSIWSISAWEVLIGVSFQSQHLPSGIQHWTSVNVVGTLHIKASRILNVGYTHE